jgi:hypothetical protein
MKKTIFIIGTLSLAVYVLLSCQKGSVAPDLGNKNFAKLSPTGNTKYATLSGTTTATAEDSGDDGEGGDDGGDGSGGGSTPANALTYKGNTGSGISVSCSSNSNYYGLSGKSSSPSFTATVYLKSKPTNSGSASIEAIGGSSPSSANSAWLSVIDGTNVLTASAGQVVWSVSGTAVTVFFTSVMVSASSTINSPVSGTITCH